MEAKDRAIAIRKRVELPDDHSLMSMIAFADAVAEISFKAGQESGCYAEGYSNGIREVVEWVYEELEYSSAFQAKLKEWNIEKK